MPTKKLLMNVWFLADCRTYSRFLAVFVLLLSFFFFKESSIHARTQVLLNLEFPFSQKHQTFCSYLNHPQDATGSLVLCLNNQQDTKAQTYRVCALWVDEHYCFGRPGLSLLSACLVLQGSQLFLCIVGILLISVKNNPRKCCVNTSDIDFQYWVSRACIQDEGRSTQRLCPSLV